MLKWIFDFNFCNRLGCLQTNISLGAVQIGKQKKYEIRRS